MKHYTLVKQLHDTEEEKLVEFVKAEQGHSYRAIKAYAVESHKYKLTNAIRLTGVAVALLQSVANRGLLGEIKEKIVVNKRAVALENITVGQMMAKFATVQRAAGIFLQELLLQEPEIALPLVEHRLYLAVNDVQAVMSFLVRMAMRTSGMPNYAILSRLSKELLTEDIARLELPQLGEPAINGGEQ